MVVSAFDGGESLTSTLACLAKQKTRHAFEVVMVDGCGEGIEPMLERHRVRLDLQHVRCPNALRRGNARNRVLHGENTSIKKVGLQKTNHFIAVNNALRRQGLTKYVYEEKNPLNRDDRLYRFVLS